MKLLHLKLSAICIALILVCSSADAQKFSFETGVSAQKYSNTISQSGLFKLNGIYHFNKKVGIGLGYAGSSARHNIRMSSSDATSINWGGVVGNLVTLSNTFNASSTGKRIYDKGYIRNIHTYTASLYYSYSSNFRMYVGPSIRRNIVATESTDEVTNAGTLFSELEFDPYTNFGFILGIDIIHNFNKHIYMSLGIDVQNDIITTSKKLSSDFKGASITYGLAFGFRIFSSSNNKEESLDPKL